MVFRGLLFGGVLTLVLIAAGTRIGPMVGQEVFVVSGASILAATALGATTTILGSSAQGAQAGDRNLAAAANETLCFRVALPSGTGNAFQSATAVTTFTFDAEQTSSNP